MNYKSGLKKVGKAAALTALVAFAAAAGRYSALDHALRIERNDGVPYITAVSGSGAYEVHSSQGALYCGSSSHNMRGVQAVAVVEGERSRQPEVDRLQTKNEALEDKIFQRQITDAFEGLGTRIKYSWLNFKHELLD